MTTAQLFTVAARADFPEMQVGLLALVGPGRWRRFVDGPGRAWTPARRARLAADLRRIPQLCSPTSSPWAAEAMRSSLPVTGTETARPGPTAAHWRAARCAMEKVLHLGAYAYIGPQLTAPPRFEGIRWDVDSGAGFDYANTNGRAVLHLDGRAWIELRSDMAPHRLHLTAIHEMQHIVDYEWAWTWSRSHMEARASVAVACLGSLPW